MSKDFRKVYSLICLHETKYGTDTYVSLHPSRETALKYADFVKEDCEYDPLNDSEYFDWNIQGHVIDINALSPAFPQRQKEKLL